MRVKPGAGKEKRRGEIEQIGELEKLGIRPGKEETPPVGSNGQAPLSSRPVKKEGTPRKTISLKEISQREPQPFRKKKKAVDLDALRETLRKVGEKKDDGRQD